MKQALIERVLEEIKHGIAIGDVTAIEELLTFVPVENLIYFLPEEEWDDYR